MDQHDERRPTVREVLERDGDNPPAYLFENAPYDAVPRPYDKARYFSPDWHAQEVACVWERVWQMACREEELPEPGDFVVYDIADRSIIVMRTEGGSLRAFYNSCLHRGSQLLPSGARSAVTKLRCPYHGWTYDLDGQLVDMPSAWDFPQYQGCKLALAQVRVDSWGGFVFVTMNPEAGSLSDYLGILPSHVSSEDLATRRIGAHVAKVIACNWKVGLEAFLEGYHVAEVHPQALPFTGDTNGQLDVWPPHVSRMIANIGQPSPRASAASQASSGDALRAFLPSDMGDLKGEDLPPRQQMAKAIRQMLGSTTNVDHAAHSTSEIIDAINYHVFPNFMPWTGYGTPIVYRLRPYGNDPDRSILEVYLLFAAAPGEAVPAMVETRWLEREQSWTAAPELGGLGAIFDQDEQNFLMIQRGLKAGGRAAISPSDYQESRIRFFHDTLDRYLDV